MWDESGYELSDPKYPTFHDRYADAADDARKRDRENGIPNPLVQKWEDEQRALASKFGSCGTVDCIMPAGHTGGCFICR